VRSWVKLGIVVVGRGGLFSKAREPGFRVRKGTGEREEGRGGTDGRGERGRGRDRKGRKEKGGRE